MPDPTFAPAPPRVPPVSQREHSPEPAGQRLMLALGRGRSIRGAGRAMRAVTALLADRRAIGGACPFRVGQTTIAMRFRQLIAGSGGHACSRVPQRSRRRRKRFPRNRLLAAAFQVDTARWRSPPQTRRLSPRPQRKPLAAGGGGGNCHSHRPTRRHRSRRVWRADLPMTGRGDRSVLKASIERSKTSQQQLVRLMVFVRTRAVAPRRRRGPKGKIGAATQATGRGNFAPGTAGRLTTSAAAQFRPPPRRLHARMPPAGPRGP